MRGRHVAADGTVCLADNDGWVVTDAFDGAMQRYWASRCCGDEMGPSWARSGWEAPPTGIPEQGYVLRNESVQLPDGWYRTDNDGVLSRGFGAIIEAYIDWGRSSDLSDFNRGDIVVNVLSHCCIYLGDGMVVNACQDYGGIGDSNGREIWAEPWFEWGWNGRLRITGASQMA